MKVLMINPPYNASKYKFIGLVAPPLGIAYIAAMLERNGVTVKILDAPALEIGHDAVKNEIQSCHPDIVAVTSVTPSIGSALKTAKISKEANPDAITVLGGYHPTFTYEEVLKNDFVDVVVCGEGEQTMVELVDAIDKGKNLREINGIAVKDYKTTPRAIIKDLDSIPFPARHLLPMDEYKILNMKLTTGTIVSGRGCPYKCSFCASSAMHGHKLRLRSAENVVDEMEHLVADHNIEMVAFMDDTFTINKSRVYDICETMNDRGLDNYWGCTARVDTISEDLLKTMKDAGCITIFLGVESADQQLLNQVNKKTNINRIKKTFELTKKYDMRTIASVVLGMPGDTKRSVKSTIKFVKNLDPSYAVFSLATPYPGTDFYIKAASENLIKINDWSKYTLLSPVLETVDLSLEELKKLQKKAFKEFYLRPSYIAKQTWMDGPIILKTIASIVKGI
jgi:anaerobic magnesium-protoporphyrin IX monomethyl ester cyclase